MKTKLIRSCVLGFAALALASCQAPSSTPKSALSCNKCGIVYFKAPATSSGSGGKGFVSLKPASRMDCADCENKVIAWVKTGSLTQHTCKTCGGTLNHCTSH